MTPETLQNLEKALSESLSRVDSPENYNLKRLVTLAQYETSGKSLMTVLIRQFLETTPAVIQSLKRAESSEDFEQVGHSAHTLRSSSLTLGLLRLGELCESLEKNPALLIAGEIEKAWISGCRWLQQVDQAPLLPRGA